MVDNHVGSHVIVVFVFSQANCPSKAIKKPLNEIQPLRQNHWEDY